MTAQKIIDRIERQEHLIVAALGRAGRVQAGSKTHEKHYSDFIKQREKFSELITQLRHSVA